MDMNSLAHTKWECKYHIVFAPKFRRKVIYGQIKADVGNILSMLCKRKGIEIIEAECMPGSLTLCLPLDFHTPLHYSPLRLIFLSNFKILLVIVCHCVV